MVLSGDIRALCYLIQKRCISGDLKWVASGNERVIYAIFNNYKSSSKKCARRCLRNALTVMMAYTCLTPSHYLYWHRLIGSPMHDIFNQCAEKRQSAMSIKYNFSSMWQSLVLSYKHIYAHLDQSIPGCISSDAVYSRCIDCVKSFCG